METGPGFRARTGPRCQSDVYHRCFIQLPHICVHESGDVGAGRIKLSGTSSRLPISDEIL